MKEQKPNAVKEIFSGSNGHLSSKRVLGGLVLVACLVFIIIQGVREGMTDNIKDLFELLIITSTALLGITSITGIWKNKKPNRKNEHKDC